MLSKSKQRLIDRLKRPRSRAKEALALVEGPRVALEVLRSETDVRWMLLGEVFASTEVGRLLSSVARAKDVPVELHADEVIKAAGATESSQPVLLIAGTPVIGVAPPSSRGRFLYLDGIQDPGNVGTLIRSAWCFGLSGVALGDGTADPWSPKALRAAAGGTFHLSFFKCAADRIADDWGLPLLFAEGGLESAETAHSSLGADWVLAIGNEGAGVSQGVRSHGRGVSIPMAPGVDSLNAAVAGSILMYVLSRPGTSP